MLEKVKAVATNLKNVFRTDSVYRGFPSHNISANFNTSNIQSVDLGNNMLELIYSSEGIGKRIVDCIVDDGMRQFIDCDADLLAELERIKAKAQITKAGKFGRLFGGALLVAMVDDGKALEQPLSIDKENSINSIHKIHSLQVFDRTQITHTSLDINYDIFSPYFMQPEIYTINLNAGLLNSDTVGLRVHRSRCYVFRGETSTNTKKRSNQGWESSVLNKMYTALTNFLESQDCTVAVQRDFVQVVVKIKDLIHTLTTDDGKAALNGRMASLNILKSMGLKNMVVMDAEGEDYTKHSSSMGGFAEATDRIAEYLAAVSGYPLSKLLGRAAAGLNATGDGDMQNYYDAVRAWRNDNAKDCIQWLIDIASAQSTWRKKPSNLAWEFPSLTAPSEKEQAEIREIYAKIDWGYADRMAIDLAEAYKERFGTGKFHENIKIGTLEIDKLELDADNADLAIDKEEEKLKQEEKKEEKTDEIIDALYDMVI